LNKNWKHKASSNLRKIQNGSSKEGEMKRNQTFQIEFFLKVEIQIQSWNKDVEKQYKIPHHNILQLSMYKWKLAKKQKKGVMNNQK
jgi:hypothetical protein